MGKVSVVVDRAASKALDPQDQEAGSVLADRDGDVFAVVFFNGTRVALYLGDDLGDGGTNLWVQNLRDVPGPCSQGPDVIIRVAGPSDDIRKG